MTDAAPATEANDPLVSMVILCFNQEAYIEAAIASALAQDYPSLEILVSDDCSTDATALIARTVLAAYRGPHDVRLNVNPVNLGIGPHVNQLFRTTRGRLVVLCGGDDISHPTRVSRLVERWRETGWTADSIYCGARKIDAGGAVVGVMDTEIARRQDACHLIEFKHMNRMLAVGACGAYSRRVIDRFGELEADLAIEDIPLLLRAAMGGGVEYVDALLVDYRVNVSVWRDIRRPGDTFEKRQRRRDFYTLQRWRVARQVLKDALSTGRADLIRSASLAYMLHDFVRASNETQYLSWRRLLAVALFTRQWRYPFVAGFLDGHPRIHRLLFAIKILIFGNDK